MDLMTAPVVKIQLFVGLFDVQVSFDGVALPNDLDVQVVHIRIWELVREVDTRPKSVPEATIFSTEWLIA